MKQKLTEEQLKSVSGGVSSTDERYEVYREVYDYGNDHGIYYIEYSDGSSETVEF